MNRPNQNDFLARPVPRNPAVDHAFAANMSWIDGRGPQRKISTYHAARIPLTRH